MTHSTFDQTDFERVTPAVVRVLEWHRARLVSKHSASAPELSGEALEPRVQPGFGALLASHPQAESDHGH